ncbi:MAG: hypothetical protein NVV60_01555 [Luteimonas sp.]|nr:hypothetical protein [Luteimonas sp.]
MAASESEFDPRALYELSKLAQDMADEFARRHIEGNFTVVRSGGAAWYDLRSGEADANAWLEQVMRYFDLRGEDLPYLVVHSQAFPALVKFEER